MEATSVLHSKTYPLSLYVNNNHKLSFRHFNKHLQFTNSRYHRSLKTTHRSPFSPHQPSLSPRIRKPHFLPPLKCSVSDATTNTEPQNLIPRLFKNLSFDSLKKSLSQLTPIRIVKWSAILSSAIAFTKWTVNLLLSPFFWMYFSWTWLFWPWIAAVSLAICGLYCFYKHSVGEASVFEQIVIISSVFTWLTLVPPAHFNGFLEGWPFVFFFVYHYFFFFSVTIRKRLYGDYYARQHDPKWDVSPPNWQRLLFCVGVMIGHWLAAFEGPELHLIPGGWSNVGVWILIVITLLMQYNASLYLAKYSEKVVVPTAVVQFGPYRWVRHPIYASTMLLFATYCVSLRAPMSLLFLVAVCLMYYDQKAKLEEALMVETFGERYMEFAGKVRYKFIPFVY